MFKTSMRRKLTALGTAAAALGLAFSGLMTGTAQADIRHCSGGAICLWQHSDYNGAWNAFHTGDTKSNLGPFNDRASSVYNHTNIRYCLYQNAGYTGDSIYVPAGARFRDLAIMGFNDRTSSLRPC